MTSTDRLELMLRARRFDEALLGSLDQLRGHYHVSIGLESTAAALRAARSPADRVFTNYRNHAHLLAMGSEPGLLFREIFARRGSPQKGRAGTFHLADPGRGVPYTSAMVGGAVPLALGAALARRRTEQPGLVFAFFGDGAMGEGVVHECLNLAQLWSLPVVFVCENNGSRAGDQANAYQTTRELTDLPAAHGIHAEPVDARRPWEAEATMLALCERVRGRGGPAFLEARAPAWAGNEPFFPRNVTGPTDLGDATRINDDPWKDDDDPLLGEARHLLECGETLESLRALDERASREMHAALDGALEASGPDRADALGDVVAGS